MKHFIRGIVLLWLLACMAGAHAQSVSAADQSIFAELAAANLAEVEWGKLAATRARSDEVKRFAQRMVSEHGAALEQVQQLAQTKGVRLPSALDGEQQKIADTLGGLSGAAFDAAYTKQAGQEAHRQTLNKLKAARSKARDADLVALIERLQPAVEQHLHAVPGKDK